MRILALFRIGVFVLATVVLASAQPKPAVDVQTLGPKVGERVPDFSGTDQFGRTRTLASVVRERGAMIVFFRSADW